MRATSWPIAPSPRMPSVLPVSGWATVCTHLPRCWFSTATAYGLAMWKIAPMMFSGIDSVCVPRAQVSARPDGRSGRASQPSTPALIAWAQRSFGMVGSRPGGTAPAISASVRASCWADGLSLRGSVSTATRSASPAAAMASR